jgi:hypothetical protein
MPRGSRPENLSRPSGIPMGKFFLVIIAISIALVLGTAVVVTYF